MILEQIPEFSKKLRQYKSKVRQLEREYRDNEKKCIEKIEKLKGGYVNKLIFNKIVKKGKNDVTKNAMKNFFK